jgi:hypothetical protein
MTTKGMLITASTSAMDGRLTLKGKSVSTKATMENIAGTSKGKITIIMEFDNALVGDHDTTKLSPKEIFIGSKDGVNIDNVESEKFVIFQSLDPKSGVLTLTEISFLITAEAGKVGGPGI